MKRLPSIENGEKEDWAEAGLQERQQASASTRGRILALVSTGLH